MSISLLCFCAIRYSCGNRSDHGFTGEMKLTIRPNKKVRVRINSHVLYKNRVKNIRYYELDIEEPDLNRDAVHLNYLGNGLYRYRLQQLKACKHF